MGKRGRAKVKEVREAPAIASIENVQPWERLPDESDPAWEAFILYRDQGLKRSLQNVAEALSKSDTLMKRWSAHHRWVERARAWDMEQDRVTREAELQEIREMRRRHINVALTMQGVSMKELRKLLAQVDARTSRAALEGTDDEVTITPDQILRLAELGVKLERINRGEPDSIVENQGGQAVVLYLPDNKRDD